MLRIEITNNGTANIPENEANPPDGEPFYFIGDYDYKVFADGDLIGQGHIGNHNRLTGWEGLLSCLNRKVNGDRFEE